MMNMWNQGSKEDLGVKSKDGICVKLCLKLWFESGCFFVILITQDGFQSSSNINEVIRAISTLFIFFYEKISHTKKAQKRTKTHISKQKQKRQLFYALKKYLRRRKLLIRLFAFLCFLCAQKRQHFYAQ